MRGENLILLNVLIPGVDGISFVQRLRSAANTATVPIILLSASDEKEILLHGMKAGADDFMLKPFNPAELLVRLSTHRHLTGLHLEAATRRSDERYRLIVESATDFAIFTLDAQRRVTSWNSGAEILTGYAADDIIGQSGDILKHLEDERDRLLAAEQAARQEAEAANQAKDRFLVALSHELRTPRPQREGCRGVAQRQPADHQGRKEGRK